MLTSFGDRRNVQSANSSWAFFQHRKDPTEVGTLNASSFSKVPRCSRVAPFTNREIVVAKRALAVMTSHATLSPSRRVMIERFRRGNLSALRQAGPDLMTFIAGDLLMLCMTKANTERRRELGRPRISAQLMTSAA